MWHFLQENLPKKMAYENFAKDRVSNFDAELWYFPQENLQAANAKVQTLYNNRKVRKNGL